MSDVSQKSVSIYIDQSAAESALEKLQSKADGFSKKIDEARQKQASLRDEIQKLQTSANAIDGLRTQYDTLKKSVDASKKSLQDNLQQQKNLSEQAATLSAKLEGATIKQTVLADAIKKNEDAGKSVAGLQRQYAAVEKEIEVTTQRIDANNVAMQTAARDADTFKASITNGKVALKDLNKEITDSKKAASSIAVLDRELKSLDSSVDGYAKSLDTVDKQQRIITHQIDQGIGPSLTQQRNLVEKLRHEWENLPSGTQAYIDKLEELKKAKANLDELQGALDGVGEAQGSWLDQFKSIAIGVSIADLIGNAVSSIGDAIQQSISSVIQLNSQFENSVANLSAVTGATGQDLDYLKNQAVELSKTGARSATDFVEAFKLIASAKPELLNAKEDLVAVTQAANLLSNAAGIELPDAATRLTDALNQFGGPAADAGKYVDALAAASKYGSAEIGDITDALLQFGTQAKSSNIDIYESSAAIELLAEKGQKGADAGTKLRNVFLAMNAVDALPKNAIEALKAAGVNTDKLNDKSLSLEERLKELGKIQNNATALVQVFGKENFNAAQILLQNIPRYAELTSQIKEQGVAEKQAATNTNTLSNAWEKFKNVLASRFLDGNNTYLKRLVKDLTETIEPTKSTAEQFYELSKNIAHLQIDIGPLTTRYEELKKKATELGGVTKLTTQEQAEMKSIINQIIEVVPGAATEFDKYGNAIAISTGRVYDFITAETARLKVLNGKAIDEYRDKLQDVNEKLKSQKVIMDLIAAGKYTISESTSTGGGGFVTESRKASQDEILEQEKKNKDLLTEQLGIQKEIEKLNGNELGQQLQRANVIKQLEDMLSKLKEGTKEYINLQNEINTLKGLPLVTPTITDPTAPALPTAEEIKKREEALKKFQEFIKGIDEAIVNNQIPEHTKPLLEALRKVADETAKLNDFAKLDKKGNPTAITLEDYVAGSKKILLEYQTWLQKFVEDESKNFNAPINNSTIADGKISATPSKPKVDLPINLNTDVTAEEEQALKEKLQKLHDKLAADAKLGETKKQIRLQIFEDFEDFGQEAISLVNKLGEAQANREQKELNNELKANDKKKAALQKQLSQKLISQQSYNQAVANLDAEAEKKKEALERKQFERTKRLQIAQAIVNGAQAITQIFATVPKVIPSTIIPNPEFPIALTTAIATNLAEIGVIAASKYAAGGKIEPLSNGKITAAQNVATTKDGDNVLAYVKRGEVVMNEEQQKRAGGPAFFRSIGVPGFAGGGLVPSYQTRSYSAIDYAGATRSMQTVKMYANGGVVTTGHTTTQPQEQKTDPELLETLQQTQAVNMQLVQINQQLLQQISKGITAVVPLKKISDAQDQQARILEQASFK